MIVRRGLFLLLFAVFLSSFPPMSRAESYVAVTEEYPPYEYRAGGKPVGMDIEILEAAAKHAGITVLFEFVPWTRAEKEVQEGTADAIFSLIASPERKNYLYFPEVSLGIEKNVLFATRDFRLIPTTLSDLRGMTVGTCRNYFYGEPFDSNDEIVREEAFDNEMLLKKMVAGRYKIGIMNEAVGWYLVKKLGLEGLKTLPVKLGTFPFYIGFSKASPKGYSFYQAMRNSLSIMEKSGELEYIQTKYLK